MGLRTSPVAGRTVSRWILHPWSTRGRRVRVGHLLRPGPVRPWGLPQLNKFPGRGPDGPPHALVRLPSAPPCAAACPAAGAVPGLLRSFAASPVSFESVLIRCSRSCRWRRTVSSTLTSYRQAMSLRSNMSGSAPAPGKEVPQFATGNVSTNFAALRPSNPAVASCSITLMQQKKPLTVASTAKGAVRLDETPYRAGVGPCPTAIREGTVIHMLATPAEYERGSHHQACQCRGLR